MAGAPTAIWAILGTIMFGFLLFIPIGLVYWIVRSIQKSIERRRVREERTSYIV